MANLSNINNKFIVEDSGDVGIGVTTATTKLHIGGIAPGDSIIRQDSTVSGTNWEIGERAAGKWQIFEDDGDTIVATFMSTGNVGIGTDSPDAKLDVQSSGSWGAYGRGSSGDINVENTNTSVNEGGWIGIAGYTGNTANSGFYPMAGITAKKSTSSGDGNYGGDLSFWTTAGTGQSPEANSGMYQRMTINRFGNVAIGTTVMNGKLSVAANDATTTPPVSSGIFVGPYQGNTAVGSAWSYSNSAGTYTDFSSRYNSDASYMRFVMKASATPVYAMTIRGSGNIGIGTDSPDAKLHIYGSASLSEMYLGEDAAADKAGILKYTQGNGSGTGVITLSHWGNNSLIEGLAIKYGGNVGIGTTSPATTLEVAGAITLDGAAAGGTSTYFDWRNNGSTFAYSGSHAAIVSGGGANDYVPGWCTGSNNLLFGTANTERMRIDSNGAVGIGDNNVNYKLRVKSDATVANGVYISAGTGSGNHTLYVENQDSSAEYFAVRGDGEIRLNASSGHTFANNGIRFGTNAAANNLDHYEEGTWTPSITAAGGNAATATYSTAYYTKVGRIVNANVYIHSIDINSITSGTYILITGFPFTSLAYADFTSTYHVGGWSGGAIVGGYVQSGQSYAYLMRASGAEANQTSTDLTMTRFMLNVTYQTT